MYANPKQALNFSFITVRRATLCQLDIRTLSVQYPWLDLEVPYVDVKSYDGKFDLHFA